MLRLLLELKDKGRRVVIRAIWWSKETKSISCSIAEDVGSFNAKKAYRLSHVLWWLQTGRRVRKGNVIHHVDHNPRNTLVENYEILTRAAHARHHMLGVKRSKKTRKKMKRSAKVRSDTPEFRRLVSDRATRQHREKKFGAHTWTHRHYPDYFLSTYSNVVPERWTHPTYRIHVIRNRRDGKLRHQAVCSQAPMRNFDKSERKWKITKEDPTCARCLAYLAKESKYE